MKFHDRLYGDIVIDEPVVQELIESKAMTRIGAVSQGGYEEPFFPGTWHPRLEHCKGDYQLLTIHRASLHERVNGLLHDVSHPAFSHCCDYLHGTTECQSAQDNSHEEHVMSTDIPAILEKYGMRVADVLDDARYPLSEKDLPDLCADRLDYGMRGALVYKEAPEKDVKRWLTSLKSRNGQWMFEDVRSAEEYSLAFMGLNSKYYAHFKSSVMGYSVGNYLRRAMDMGVITMADIYSTDAELLAKVEPYRAGDAELRKHFRRMNNLVETKDDPTDYEHQVRVKSRVVDPLVIVNGTLQRLTALVPSYKEAFERERHPKVHHLHFADSDTLRKAPAA